MTIVLTEHLQPKHGLYYALTGKTMNAKEAERIGLITKAVPRAELDKEVMEIANNLKEKAPRRSTLSKRHGTTRSTPTLTSPTKSPT